MSSADLLCASGGNVLIYRRLNSGKFKSRKLKSPSQTGREDVVSQHEPWESLDHYDIADGVVPFVATGRAF